MRIDVATPGLAFSAVSTMVVIAGGIAALRQLRYLRHGNELATLTSRWAQYDAPGMHEALHFIRSDLAAAMHDAGFIAELEAVPPGPRAQYRTRVANFYEVIGITFILGGHCRRAW